MLRLNTVRDRSNQNVGSCCTGRRSTIVRMDERVESVRAVNLTTIRSRSGRLAKAGPDAKVAVEATYRWY